MASIAGLSNSNFLDNLYRAKFDREPDTDGKNYWADALKSGNISRAGVIASFDQSQEMKDINAEKAKASNNAAIATAANNAATVSSSTAVNNLASTSGPSTTTITLSGGGNNNNNVTTTSSNSTVSNNNSSNNNNNNQTTNSTTISASNNSSSNNNNNNVVTTSSNNASSGGGGGGGNDNWLQEFYTANGINAGLLSDSAKTYWEDHAAKVGIEAAKNTIEGTAKNQGNWGVSEDLDTYLSNSYDDIFARQGADSDDGVFDQTGLDWWKEEILRGRTSRDDIEAHFNYAAEKSGNTEITLPDGTTTTVSNDEAWLREVYNNPDILNREIGQEGLDWWMNDLNSGQTRGQVLANIKLSNEYACNQDSSKTWTGSACVEPTAQTCPAGQSGTPPNCVDDVPQCPAGTTGTYPDCQPIVQQCPAGQTGTPPNCVDIDDTCPSGYSGTPPNCTPDGGGDDSCPTGYTGTPPNCTPVYVADDDDDDDTAGTWMGDEDSANTQTSYLNQKTKEYEDLYQTALNDQSSLSDQLEENRVSYGELSSRYGQLKSDYDDARREADSYINAARADETGALRRGGVTGGNQASIGASDLKSGSPSYGSQEDDYYGDVTSGPITQDDRPYARRGMKKGAATGTTFFDDRSRFSGGLQGAYY